MVDGELVVSEMVRLASSLAEYYVRVEGRGFESAVTSGARDLLGVVESDDDESRKELSLIVVQGIVDGEVFAEFGDVRSRAVEALRGLVSE